MTLTPPQKAPIWDHTPEQIISISKQIFDDNKKTEDQLVTIETPTFDNFILPYVKDENESTGLLNQLTFYNSVSEDKDVRDASNKAAELESDYYIESASREDVYKSVRQVYENLPKDLDPESSRLVEKIELAYRRNGLNLPLDVRNQVKELRKKLALLSIQFSKNLAEQTDNILFTREELDGVPDDVIGQFAKISQDDGSEKLRVTFKYPDIIPVMKYSKNSETRRKAFIANENKVSANADILAEAVKIRAKVAKLSGYSNHSEYVLEVRMAKKPETVLNFLKDLQPKLEKGGLKELKTLLDLKNDDLKNRGLPEEKEFYIWDLSYYNNLLLEKKYQVNEQAISEYFPINETIQKMFGLYEHLFGLKFEEASDTEKSVWQKDVRQFAVWETYGLDKPEFLGWLYLDLHPRDGKYTHAANFTIYKGYTDEHKIRHYPVTALVCNFSKPSETKPSLLRHSEVTTLFHELGHGIHNLVAKSTYGRFHGTAVSRDFVECPSQLLEYWTWSKNELKKLSGHYLDANKQIDDDLVDKIIATKHVNGALFALRQVFYGSFDMALHTSEDGDVDIVKEWSDLRTNIALIPQDGLYLNGFTSFGHMFGYDSGYYGYLWSEVYAADIYYTKFKDDPMNTEAGIKYRDTILARGGTRDDIDNLRELLGRDPSNEAFVKELGLE